jgi:hypothetical protein
MGLLGTTTQESYYNQSQSFTGDGSTYVFTLSTTYFPTLPANEGEFEVFINNVLINPANYDYGVSGSYQLRFTANSANSDVQTGSNGAPKTNLKILIREVKQTEQYGQYQFINVTDIINNFMVSYVGEGKIISKVRKADVAFHAQRAIQELSYDTFKSSKSQEIEVPPSLNMILPQDYVNYVKISWKDDGGAEKPMYPIRHTSNPLALLQDSDYKYIFDSNGNIQTSFDSNTWTDFKKSNADVSEYSQAAENNIDNINATGSRFGLDPEMSQSNGSFFIDELKGTIYFSSNTFGRVVTLKYISDGLGTDAEMVVHKFAEEAMYKYLAHAILSTKMNIPEYVVARFKKEKFAATRTAKLRLSNLKSEELAQVMKNKSKQIKH